MENLFMITIKKMPNSLTNLINPDKEYRFGVFLKLS